MARAGLIALLGLCLLAAAIAVPAASHVDDSGSDARRGEWDFLAFSAREIWSTHPRLQACTTRHHEHAHPGQKRKASVLEMGRILGTGCRMFGAGHRLSACRLRFGRCMRRE